MAQEPEYIYPPNTLKSKVTVDASKVDAVALKQAEMAIEDMQDDYLGWVKMTWPSSRVPMRQLSKTRTHANSIRKKSTTSPTTSKGRAAASAIL